MTIVIKGSGGSIKFKGSGGGISITSLGGGGGGGGFDPLSLGSLSAWYKADALGLSNGATVTSWVDSSGTGNTLVSYSGTPIYNSSDATFNNQPTVSFDQSSRLSLTSPTGLPVGAPDLTTYVVALVNNTGLAHNIFGWGVAANACGVGFVGTSATTSYFPEYIGDGYAMFFSEITGHKIAGSVGVPVVLSFSMNAGTGINTGELYKNNVMATQQAAANNIPAFGQFGTNEIAVGDMGGYNGYDGLGGRPNRLNGKFAEALVYNAKHDNTTRLQVTQYLAAKYGISI